MMGRELIYPGEKQIKALLRPACRHTIAYINILSRAMQVRKGLEHLHIHKGLLSMLWPLLPSRLSSWRVPAVLSFTSQYSSLHFPHQLLCLSHSCTLFLLLRSPPLELLVSLGYPFPASPPTVLKKMKKDPIFIANSNVNCSKLFIHSDMTCSSWLDSLEDTVKNTWHNWKYLSDLWTCALGCAIL